MQTTQALVNELLRVRSETPTVEVKAATGGMPRSILETLSAFSNDKGGTILLGLTDPADGLKPANGFDPESVRSAVEDAVREKITPPINADIYIDSLNDGTRILRIDVPEGDYREKPFYVKSKNLYGGSYTRPGEGDRLLTPYEIDRLRENRGQPTYDQEPVREATESSLDTELVQRYVQNLQERQPRVFAQLTHQQVLLRSKVLVEDSRGNVHPSLAGLLALGTYPQQYFPQLEVSVVVLPGETMGEITEEGARFLDNQTCSGAIPYIIQDATQVLMRNMRNRAVMVAEGLGRVNRYDYPLDVIRELIANALMHRDYSPESRGTQIQVELYPHRLVVRSPGGIYGGVTAESLGRNGVSSSRNALLAKILADLPLPGAGHMVAENRGSGIPSIFASLHNSGMEEPEFLNRPSLLEVSVKRMSDFKDAAQPVPERIFADLVPKAPGKRVSSQERLELILQFVKTAGSASAAEITSHFAERGMQASRPTLQRDIDVLLASGKLEATAPPKSKNRRYRLKH